MRSLALLTALSLSTNLAAPVTLNLSVMNGDQPSTGQLTTSAGQTTVIPVKLDAARVVAADLGLARSTVPTRGRCAFTAARWPTSLT